MAGIIDFNEKEEKVITVPNMETKHTIEELKQWQSFPLQLKIAMSLERIRNWVNEFDSEVYIAFSGGKDSTVLLDLVRRHYPDIKAAYADTGLEFPELRKFVKTIDNVDWVKPKKTFKQVIIEQGYPFLSKTIAHNVDIARRHPEGRVMKNIFNPEKHGPYAMHRYLYLTTAPFRISDHCCSEMKKKPMRDYEKKSKLKPILGVQAAESRMRTDAWLKHGCNMYEGDQPKCQPLSFWTDQDILFYIKYYNLPYANVYGDIILDNPDDRTMDDIFMNGYENVELFTTGCDRTGCAFCGFGCHLEERPNRFELIDVLSNPSIRDHVLRGGRFNEAGLWEPDDRGLGYWFVIKWLNNHSKTINIYIPEYEKYEKEYGNELTEKYLNDGVVADDGIEEGEDDNEADI